MVVLTKVDKLCPEVEKDIGTLFRSVRVQRVMKTASEVFHVSEASIHPVKNYEVDIELRVNINIPILLALRQILQYAAQSVYMEMNKSDDSDDSDDSQQPKSEQGSN